MSLPAITTALPYLFICMSLHEMPISLRLIDLAGVTLNLIICKASWACWPLFTVRTEGKLKGPSYYTKISVHRGIAGVCSFCSQIFSSLCQRWDHKRVKWNVFLNCYGICWYLVVIKIKGLQGLLLPWLSRKKMNLYVKLCAFPRSVQNIMNIAGFFSGTLIMCNIRSMLKGGRVLLNLCNQTFPDFGQFNV